MLKLIFTSLSVGCILFTSAQQLKLPVGKKFQMITETKGNNVTSMMGQDMEMSTSTTVYVDNELKSASGNKFSIGLTIKRVVGNVSVMGQEQTFDSDDESLRSNPAFADATKALGKESEIVVEDGQVSKTSEIAELTKAMSPGDFSSIFDIGRFFLLLKESDIKVGFAWTSNNSSETASTENNYIIEKITDKEVEVVVQSKVKVSATMNQNGMDIKQQTEGTIKSTRTYDKQTGLLISELANGAIKGNMEVMGQQVPLDSKVETKTTIKLL